MSRDDELQAHAIARFARQFGAKPTIVARAPGRVELLGNHTDYNGGLVLSAAIDRETYVVGRPSDSGMARVLSIHFEQEASFELQSTQGFHGEPGPWVRYIQGIVSELAPTVRQAQSGLEAAILGDIPLGTGLSSSASLEAAFALFLLQAGSSVVQLDHEARMRLAQLLQRVEHVHVGVACGVLDQFSVLFGQADHALWLDCASLDFGRVSMGNPAPAIVVCDSKTSRRLADGMYNQRRAECESVVSYFQSLKGTHSTRWLRDVTLSELEYHWDHVDAVGRKRARHVLTENARVREGIDALRMGNLATFGRILSASHASSRDDFENSSPALDNLIEAAEHSPGFLGGKLSGAGWAGCTVNLVPANQAEVFADSVRRLYASKNGLEPDIHICCAADGARSRAIT